MRDAITGRPVKKIFKRARLGNWCFDFSFKSKNHFMGRFGGGWDWMLGAQWGPRDLIINLFVCQIRIHHNPPRA